MFHQLVLEKGVSSAFLYCINASLEMLLHIGTLSIHLVTVGLTDDCLEFFLMLCFSYIAISNDGWD